MDRPRTWLAPFTVLLLGASLVVPSGALAQDASPTAVECDAPALPPGTPTAMEEMGGMAMGTPEAGMDMATPEGEMAAESAATPEMPVASPIPAGEPADEATAERVTAAIANLIACNNSGQYLAVAALITPEGLMNEFGITNPYDAEMALAGGPPLTLISVEDVQVHDDGRYSADVHLSYGGPQVARERWFLVEAGEYLLVDETPDLSPEAPEGAVTVDVATVDYAFEMSQTTVPANTPIVFKVDNLGAYPHEFVVVQLPEGATVEQALEGEIAFEEIVFVGATYSEGGQPAPDLVVTGIEPGVYTVVCFVDVPEGIPHVARGMIAELTVE